LLVRSQSVLDTTPRLALTSCIVVMACSDGGSSEAGTEATSEADDDTGSLGTTTAVDSEGSPTGASTSGTSTATSTGPAATGSTGSTESTGADATDTTGGLVPGCGNDVVEAGEACDGLDLGARTCASIGFPPGELACDDACTLDTTACLSDAMVLVPAGTFEMGSNEARDEQPIRQVTLDAYWIDVTEVTVTAYAACVAALSCPEPDDGGWFTYNAPGLEDHPLNGVTWGEAGTYCQWQGKRLPTEAEWEKAARGVDAREFPWGDAPAPDCTRVVMEEAGVDGCGLDSTWPVASKPLGASPYGALDMSGNVWEWTADFFGPYDPGKTVNPQGPVTGGSRVVRGGAWNYADPDVLRTAGRGLQTAGAGTIWVGFRCAQSVPPAP
jgi:formylglycine-generating enzyme required for sulfatase activity